MTDKNIEYLQQYIAQWHQLKYTGVIAHLDYSVRAELARIYKEELDNTAILDIHCPSCVTEWFKVLYINFEKQHGEQASVLTSVTTVNPNGESPASKIAEAAAELVTIETTPAPVKERKPGRPKKESK